MGNINFLIAAIITLFLVSIIGSIIYIGYMSTKRRQYPHITFSRFYYTKADIRQLEDLTNETIRGVNGWVWLATTFLTLYYFINFWSLAFMVLNITIVAYDAQNYRNLSLLLVSGSLFLTCLDLFINTKEKGIRFHKQWFITSEITRKYIVEFAAAESFSELRTSVDEFNMAIEEKNRRVEFF